MKPSGYISQLIRTESYGTIATASLLLCLLSGVIIAIPYDIDQPLESIRSFILNNPYARLFRNLHYWTAQFFLIFSVLHIYDHFKKKTEVMVKRNAWTRLSISILAIFFVMLSGFILKADADSIQARNILSSLISSLPLIGDFLNSILIGKEGDYELLYVHHIATASIFIIIVIIEHAQSIWTRLGIFTIVFIISIGMSAVFQAPLHAEHDTVLKGPWYFVGMQEILHWLSNPLYLIIPLLGFIVLIVYMPKMSTAKSAWLKRILLILLLLYTVVSIIGYFFRGENWEWHIPWEKEYSVGTPYVFHPIAFDKSLEPDAEIRESCMYCHSNVTGLSSSHHPEAIGCYSCHGGNPYTLNKTASHREMHLIPGNLNTAQQSCGTTDCHPDLITRVNNNLMTTMSGMISVDRYVFGETEGLDHHFHVQELGHSAADQHFRDMCANCHLGNEKDTLGPINQLSRGGGCLACHLQYSAPALVDLNKREKLVDNHSFFHPNLSIEIGNDHCFGCHSRSGRISTNYEGWHETTLKHDELESNHDYRVLKDKRVFEFVEADIHHQAGMECIDCHTSYEVMGDGNRYFHKEDQQRVHCEDCHTTESAQFVSLEEANEDIQRILPIRPGFAKISQVYQSSISGEQFYHIQQKGNQLIMYSKNNNTIHTLNPPAAICSRGDAHNNVSCSACHTSWAPQCIGCHNTYEHETPGYDLLDNKHKLGTWVEYTARFLADPPTLGIFEINGKNEVRTFTPGMIMTIDKESYTNMEASVKGYIFHRLYAPGSPHTINKQGRSCTSCHLSSLAMGYGRGKLEYSTENGKGEFVFTPRFAKNENDGLPQDAWIGFMQERNDLAATRTNARPFSLEEQKRMLRVGACLYCHDEDSPIILNSLDDFEAYLKTISDQCILPE